MSNGRKLEAMHKHYGKAEKLTCGYCCNLIEGRYHDKVYRKCTAYGLSHTPATDWSRRWTACGLFGIEFDSKKRKPLIEALKHSKREIVHADGQMNLFDGGNV